jgi:hypothetical protein
MRGDGTRAARRSSNFERGEDQRTIGAGAGLGVVIGEALACLVATDS